jgi:hypothetical protein
MGDKHRAPRKVSSSLAAAAVSAKAGAWHLSAHGEIAARPAAHQRFSPRMALAIATSALA